MSTVLKKSLADKMAFKFHPKAFHIPTSSVAEDFVKVQETKSNDFKVADIVAQQAGIKDLNKKIIESQVEETVLLRLKEIEEQAYRQGHDLGEIEGAEKAFEERRANLAESLAKFDLVTKSLETAKAEILKQCEGALIKLIFEVAQRIAVREISISKEPIIDLVNNLVAEVQASEDIVVKISPADQAFIEELRSKKVKEVEKLDRVRFVSHDEIENGGCIVETNFGAIDATISQRVERAWAAIQSKIPVVKRDDSSSGGTVA